MTSARIGVALGCTGLLTAAWLGTGPIGLAGTSLVVLGGAFLLGVWAQDDRARRAEQLRDQAIEREFCRVETNARQGPRPSGRG